MKPKKKPLLPVDIKLPERVLLEGGVMFATLRTLDELEQFWEEHKVQFELACEGKGVTSGQTFLREYEWVFGTSKSAVVRTVMRWGRSGIGCDFYDWAKHDPRMHECFFHDRDAYRDSRIERGKWSDKDEAEIHGVVTSGSGASSAGNSASTSLQAARLPSQRIQSARSFSAT